jgi:hypothetical protein
MRRIFSRPHVLTVAAIILLLVMALIAVANDAGRQRDSSLAQQNDQPTLTPLPGESAAAHPTLEPTYAALIAGRRDPDIPSLPFPDNPDPPLCGIPTPWGTDNQAWLTGIYEGEMVQPVVLLYDSHLRLEIAARAAHGSEVEVILYQQNPVTDYYLVKIAGAEQPNEGWVPGPFLSFSPVTIQ